MKIFQAKNKNRVIIRAKPITLVLIASCLFVFVGTLSLAGQNMRSVFEGKPIDWHGFDRYDFVMDSSELTIKPFTAPIKEKFGIGTPDKGKRRCIVVVPKQAAPGNPWCWRGCYWDYEPQTEIELLKRGFHIAFVSADQDLKPDKLWDVWYEFFIEHGLSRKPAFLGMSRGGEYSYMWATTHPDKVSCVYADNSGGNLGILGGFVGLATNDVPLLHVCGSIDPILGRYSLPIESMYQQYGGRISTMIKEGYGHHPHGLRDIKPIADFIEHSFYETRISPPDFIGHKFTKTSYYGIANIYQYFPSEQIYITLRGPLFTPCYDRYQFELSKVDAFTTIIVPKNPAPGNPWVFRADLVDRENIVDQELLAKGFYIVTGAVPYNYDGPVLEQWNTIYTHLVNHGFSKKPVMEGRGGAAGEAYAWAIANPDKVSCIYAENPVLHSSMSKAVLLDNLAPMAKAGVPLLNVCGSLDPWLKDNTLMSEKRYKKLGGKITVVIIKSEGHYPPAPHDPKLTVDFITRAVAASK